MKEFYQSLKHDSSRVKKLQIEKHLRGTGNSNIMVSFKFNNNSSNSSMHVIWRYWLQVAILLLGVSGKICFPMTKVHCYSLHCYESLKNSKTCPKSIPY